MLVRRDGIGLSQFRVLIRTVDGALVIGEYGGVVDFGPEGYQALAAGTGPDAATCSSFRATPPRRRHCSG